MSGEHDELLVIAERQLALAEAGAWDELVAAMELFHRRAAALPPIAPAAAAPVLARMGEIVARVEDRLRAARMDTARELAALQRGGGAARAYQGAALTPGGRVDDAA